MAQNELIQCGNSIFLWFSFLPFLFFFNEENYKMSKTFEEGTDMIVSVILLLTIKLKEHFKMVKHLSSVVKMPILYLNNEILFKKKKKFNLSVL